MNTNGPSIEALAKAAGFSVRDGLQVGAARTLTPDPRWPAVLLIDGMLEPKCLRSYPLDLMLQVIVSEHDSLRADPLEIQALLTTEDLPANTVALALPAVAPEDVRNDLTGLRGVIARVRNPEGGCPWDLEQNHRSLRPHLLEETYEVLHALDSEEPGALQEELGDLLMQVFLHAQIAADAKHFDIDDVAEGIRSKLVRRHPHVFGDVEATDATAAIESWDKLKAEERSAKGGEGSVLDGVPPDLPALARAQSVAGRAARQGFEQAGEGSVTLAETFRSGDSLNATAAGEALFSLAQLAERAGVPLEDALREATDRFEARFRTLETNLHAEGITIADTPATKLKNRWERTDQTR